MSGYVAGIAKLTAAAACLFGTAHLTAMLMISSSESSLRKTPILDSYSPPVPGRHFIVPDPEPAPFSLVVPCQAEDFYLLPLFLESLANQTIVPQSTHLVLNLPPSRSGGAKLALLDDQDDEAWLHSLLVQRDDKLQGPSANKSLPETIDSVLKSRAPAGVSLRKVHNLTLHMRAGKHYAGDNRMYGANVSKADGTDIVSFFDCDDYLHPRRTEYVWKTFQMHPELEALIHGFQLIPISQWEEKFPRFLADKDYMPGNESFPWSYEQIHKGLPVKDFANEIKGEPRQVKNSMWFFPRNMNLPKHPPYSSFGHNGWLTVKRETLESVPYPVDMARGQDSLYNWRLIREMRNFNVLPLPLAAYIRQR
eukprot:Protomagalhaensia_sp_Gyna_25__5121@NODE_593_length_3046_cov_78_792484_g460_i0_p1_GENE_NODE_593_length_3046_cov_78_792484_g460_i0NODE_593_length_3046_cov_78_792484_g460_i0_p1_ORF_typecomplete_len365_score46_14Glyco_tranf_2_3/PF13641_6/0_0029Glycos_transf_2/PF00535_26/1_2e03Glycos_transf_2/PF00535_26/0_01_NODE_593_length_3046_cov_78_792484_g460_i04541548